MKINKFAWIIALVLLVSVPSVFAATGIFGNPYVIFAVNILIVWIVLSILVSFVPDKYNKVKPILWIATLALAVFIAWEIGRGSAYIWEAAELYPYINKYFIVNTLIIGAVGYFIVGFFYEPKTTQAKFGLPIIVLLMAGLIAQNIGDEWVFKNDNVKGFIDYLFAPEHIDPKTGQPVGGILRPEGPPTGKYRLLVFGTSALVFAWFLIGFLNITTGDNKLSIAMALIIAGSLAHKGQTLEVVIKMAEALSFLIVLKQIPPDIFSLGGALPGLPGAAQSVLTGLGAGLRYMVVALLVGWIFCTAFGSSMIGELIGQVPAISKIGINPCPGKACGPGLPTCPSGRNCDAGKCVSPKVPLPSGGSRSTGPPSGKPFGCFWC